jgi:uncharacterized membrane protein
LFKNFDGQGRNDGDARVTHSNKRTKEYTVVGTARAIQVRVEGGRCRRDFVMLHLFPGWNGLHVLIVHIPIILLLLAPFFVIVAIGLPAAKRRLFLGSALTLIVLGTAMTFVAVTTGEAARKVVGSAPAIEVALEEHRALAETTRELFCVLTLGFAALLFVPRLLRRELESRINTALLAIYLIFYATGTLFLVHTALQGTVLVRELETKTAATYQLSGKEGAR